ncbi:acylphosphatase-2-like [Limulus polyphemus]|uniref:Acylphosphatase-2-like n=1 Tax=Limulus polyphemus TaxID=6850 RepID=A0ABM1B6A5_LIMPO|nr:acylphosphatase-2-like [Limulus polyphemus]
MLTTLHSTLPARPLLVQVDFEVSGDVHGCLFTKYARDMCQQLGVKGWIRFSRWGTVIGQIQGEKDRVDEMALWLRLQGSPGSKIVRCDFKNWLIVDTYDFRNFSVRF